MRKFAHVIQDNKGNDYPNHIMFVDTETTERKVGKHQSQLDLKFGIACYYRPAKGDRASARKYHTFKARRQFFRFMFDHSYSGQTLYVVAHNAAFDWKVLAGFKALKKDGWTLAKLITVGVRNIWTFRKEKKKIVVIDNMNIFATSLAALGKSLGFPKMDMPKEGDPFPAWEEYCKRDVDVMVRAWEVWQQFLSEHDLGNFGMTLASQAFNAYRHRFMPTKIYIHANEHAVKLERESYHGGRTEAFRLGVLPVENYYYLDVNSMYPAQMRKEKYPTRLSSILFNLDIRALARFIDRQCVIARVVVDVPEPVFSVVANNRLIFPVGKFETVLSTRELKYALKHSYIKEVKEAAIYDCAPLFRSYVDFFYRKRLEYKSQSNDTFAFCCKLLLNSLYGKFGQRQEIWKKLEEVDSDEVKVWEEYDMDERRWRNYRLLSGILEEKEGFKEGFNSFVAVASHVTADARMDLWGKMQKVGLSNVLYVDTDSIFTNEEGYRRAGIIKSDNSLGNLSLKRRNEHLAIHGAKDYVFGDETVIKGIRRGAIEVSPSTYSQTRFEGLKGAWRAGRLDRQMIASVEKRLTRQYHKGNVTAGGIIVPFTLTLDERTSLVL